MEKQKAPGTPRDVLRITAIRSVCYFENYNNYFFPGERHPFWEMIYVDRGEIIVETDLLEKPMHLSQGELILFQPNEFHSFFANNIDAHNLFVISFEMDCSRQAALQDSRAFRVKPGALQDIFCIISEAQRGQAELPFIKNMAEEGPAGEPAPFGAYQLVKNTLEIFMIRLFREENVYDGHDAAPSTPSRVAASCIDQTTAYLKEQIYRKISIQEVCAHVGMSRSQLQKLFLAATGRTIMQYARELKIKEAKYLIRSRKMNFTEIAQMFSYSSVHNFSRQFKQVSGMSPSEYACSLYSVPEKDGFPGSFCG